MSISRSTVDIVNTTGGTAEDSRQTKINFLGFKDTDKDMAEVFAGIGDGAYQSKMDVESNTPDTTTGDNILLETGDDLLVGDYNENDDAVWGGYYDGTAEKTFYVKIDSVSPDNGQAYDTFAWSDDDFATSEATALEITGAEQSLVDGVTVTWAATTGHTLNDIWQVTTVNDITTPHALSQIIVSHQGVEDNNRGKMVITINDGVENKNVMTIHSNGLVQFDFDIRTRLGGVVPTVYDASGNIIS